MAMIASALLVSIALSAPQVHSLECLVVDPTIGYSGYVNDPNFVYCSYNPTHHTHHFVSDGLTDAYDDVARYAPLLDGYKPDGVENANIKVPHLCFDETYQLGRKLPSTVSRCLCTESRCNVRSEYPWWLRSFGHHEPTLNRTITPAELARLRYQESSRHFKISH